MSTGEYVATLNEITQVVKIANSNISVFTNGFGELFVKLTDPHESGVSVTYRMQEDDMQLHVAASGAMMNNYHSATGLVIVR